MKKSFLILCCYGCSFAAIAQPDTWTQKNDVGWNTPNGPTNLKNAVGFNIGGMGFIGTGEDGRHAGKKNCYTYDPATNKWSGIADFGGDIVTGASGFSIGNKGYLGLGMDTLITHPATYRNDWWEYDSATGVWTQKADFPGPGRAYATGFSIKDKGYINQGQQATALNNDFWQYDPAANVWTQKANFAGGFRTFATGFGLGSKGYLGTGIDNGRPPLNYRSDFWQYDPVTNSWTQKADFGGGGRAKAVSFGIGGKGYLGSGATAISKNNDFWEYDTLTDIWTRKADIRGGIRESAVGFSIGGSGYIGSGDNYNGLLNDFWVYHPAADTWTAIAGLSGSTRTIPISFSIAGKGYIGLGTGDSAVLQDLWEYDPTTGSWTQKADFAGSPRQWVIGFSIGSKGYAGIGDLGSLVLTKDFWQFDPVANTWTRKADFAGAGRTEALGFATTSKGYIGTGEAFDGSFLKDFWEYDTLADAWTPKADYGGGPVKDATGFSIGGKGYIGLGQTTGSPAVSDFWEYDPVGNNWVQKASFGGGPRTSAVGFGIGSVGYMGTGYNVNRYNDWWQYDPAADAWTAKASFTGYPRSGATGFSIGTKGYLGTGVIFPFGIGINDFWEYATSASIRTSIGDYSVTSNCPVLSGTGFNWQLDDHNGLVFGIDPAGNNLGATCWGTRNTAAATYRDSYGWFGGSQMEFGAWLPRNYVLTPTAEPTTAVTLRFYCTAQELADFLNYFNTKYGTSYTQSDIRILRYDGVNQDLDLGNNSGVPGDYTSLTPTSTGIYGESGQYRYFEISTTSLSEFSVALSSSSAPLPLRILGFSATYTDGSTLLNWQTAEEQNTGRFNIQRSVDGKNFTTIGSIPAAGHSNLPRDYSYTDYTAGNLDVPIIYYRLQETDLDGRVISGLVASVKINSVSNAIFVSPNPAANDITVHLNTRTANRASLVVTDIAGKKLFTQKISLHAGDNAVPLLTRQFPGGVYYITIESSQEKWQTKFVKP